MQIEQALKLIQHPGISNSSRMTWADLGCGSGLFTRALAQLLSPGSRIYAVDKDIEGSRTIRTDHEVVIEKLQADFVSDSMNLGNLDGILMANSLHFVFDKAAFIKKCKALFKQQEFFLIVEYDTDIPNYWVPHPVSFYSLRHLFLSLGYEFIDKIHELPSRFNQANIYSALVKR